MRTKVLLRPDDKSLSGKFPPESDHVYVLLDSTNTGFTVVLPDCRNGNQSEFIFKNIGTHTVRIQAASGQYLDTYQYHDIRPWDLITLWSDLDKRWIMLDNNSSIIPTPIIFGDETNNTTIEADGTIKLNGTATVFDDVQFPFITAKLLGTNDPVLTKICDNGSGSTGILAYSFSHTKLNEVWLSQEMPHYYKQGSSPTMHLHLYPETNLDGDILIDVEYAFNNIGSVLGNSTLTQVALNIPANSAKKHLYYELITINGSSLLISHGIGIRVARRGDLAGDTHEGAIWITRAALHIEKDGLGSRTVSSK